MTNCPNCHAAMTAQAAQVYGALPRATDVDACAACHLFWFDAGEIVALTPDAVIALVRLIGATGSVQRPLAGVQACPRCRRTLAFTRDLGRNGRFTYWRCAQGHGQLVTFGQFLAAKNVVRPPSPAELERLKATVRQVNCSQCGGPIDLRTQSACPHCGSAVMLIDPEGIARALRELDEARQRSGAPGTPATPPSPMPLSDAQIEAMFDLARQRKAEDAVDPDLLVLGAEALGALLDRWLHR